MPAPAFVMGCMPAFDTGTKWAARTVRLVEHAPEQKGSAMAWMQGALGAAGYAARACPENPLPCLVMVAVTEYLGHADLAAWYADEPRLTGDLSGVKDQVEIPGLEPLKPLLEQSPAVQRILQRRA